MEAQLDQELAHADPASRHHIPPVGSAAVEQIWAGVMAADMPGRTVRPPQRFGPRLALGTGALAVAASVALAVELVPGPTLLSGLAAAAQLDQLATKAASQPSTPLGSDQWLASSLRVELTTQVVQAGDTPTPDARATFLGTVDVWTSQSGTTCMAQQLDPARFTTSANARAWHALGLHDTPAQPIRTCMLASGTSIPGGFDTPVIDTSSLTHDPETLAQQLRTGTTGIRAVDHIDSTATPYSTDIAFARLFILLVGPTVGGPPQLDAELLQTMALLPRVTSLGSVTTNSGRSGLGFDIPGGSNGPSPTVVLDPRTGRLLEARDLDGPQLLEFDGAAFVGGKDAPSFPDGVSYRVTSQWIDPVGTPTVVEQSALPAGLIPPGQRMP